MKKTFAFLISFMMIFSLVSCSSDWGDDIGTSSTDDSTHTNNESDAYTPTNLFNDFYFDVKIGDLKEYSVENYSAYWAEYGEGIDNIVMTILTEKETEKILAIRFISNQESSSIERTISNISSQYNDLFYRINISSFPSQIDNKRKYLYQTWSENFEISNWAYLEDRLDVVEEQTNTQTANNESFQSEEPDVPDNATSQNTASDNTDSSSQAPEPISTEPTAGEKNSLQDAKDYLNYSSFSRQGLIDQLLYENYSQSEATYAVDNVGADWNAQAVKTAQSYLDYSSFSRQGLIDQLIYEGFTSEQATYGVDQTYK